MAGGRARGAALLAAAFMMISWSAHSFVLLPRCCRRSHRVVPGGHHGAAGPARDRYLSMSTSNSEKKKGKGRRRARGKRENGAPEGSRKELSEDGSLADRDMDLDAFIEDERKSTLPRLEDLKRIKSMTAGSIPVAKVKDEGSGKANLLLPRELEEIKKKEKQNELPKGAPPYFDTMTKITWGAIATMIIVESIARRQGIASSCPTILMVHRRRVLAPTATAAAIWCGGGVSGFVVPAGLSSVQRLASGSDGSVARIHAVQMDAKTFPENLVIVGSGPAGFTAAIYAGRANLKPFMFEGASETGGQLMATTEVENFPGFPDGILGPDLMANMRRQAVRWNCEIETDDVTDADLTKRPFTLIASSGKTVEANSVIVATGAKAKRLNLPSERQYWSKGITACAICDGAAPLFRDEPLGVVGGGDSALEEAVYLTKYSPEIHVFVRSDKLRASAAMQDRARANTKIHIHLNTVIEDVYGDDADKPFTKSPLRGVRVRANGGVREVPIRGLFYAIGHEPNTKVFKDLERDEMGYIKVKPGTVQTSVEGVFAAGDVHDPHWRQAVTAAGSGCMAALSAERYLSEKGLLREIRRTGSTEENIPVKPSTTSSEAHLPVMGIVSGVVTADDTFDLESTYHSGELAFAKLNDESPKPILVMFMSKTCGPCRILKPILSRVLKDFEGQIHFVEIDIEEYPDLTLRSGIAGTPTVQVYKGSELRTTLRGVKKMADYRREIEGALESSSRA